MTTQSSSSTGGSSSTRASRFRIAVRKFGPFEDAIRLQWESFVRATGTTLELDLVPLDLRPLEDALFASGGMASGDWDIAFVATDWIAAIHRLGCAVDLAPLLERDPPPGYPEAWTSSLLRLQRIGNSILGVPFHDGPECLIYRRDLFDDPALRSRFHSRFQRPLEPPTTWDDFHTLARFFQNARPGLYGTVFAAFPDGHNSVYDFLLQLWSRGGELFTPAGDPLFSTPEAAAALTFYRALLTDVGAVHPQCLSLDSVAAGARFAAGEVALMVNWFGFATYAHTAQDSAIRGSVAVAELPVGPGGLRTSLNVYWILALASGSPHRELAWQFLRWTQTPEMDRLTTTSGAIGCRRSTWADPAIRAAIPFYSVLNELHRNAREIPQREDWPRIAAIIDRLVTDTIRTATPIRELLQAADHALHSEAVAP